MTRRQARLFSLTSAAVGGLLLATTALAGASASVVDSGVVLHSGGDKSGGDIGIVDAAARKYYQSNGDLKGISWYSIGASPEQDRYVMTLGAGQFTGRPSTCAVPHACNGPDGVVEDDQGRVWAGDGNSTIKMIDPSRSDKVAATLDLGGKLRADELSFDPKDHMILIANDADGFLSFIDTTKVAVAGHYYYADTSASPAAPQAKQSLATPGNGIEQSVYDSATGLFYQALPANTDAKAPDKPTTGRIDVFQPTPDSNGNGVLVKSISVPGCDNGPTGLVLDGGNLVGACDNGGAVVNIASGQVSQIVKGVGGADEVYNPGGGNIYFFRSGPGMLGIVDAASFNVVANLPTGKGDHSGAAGDGQVFAFAPGKGSIVFQVISAVPAPIQAPS